MQFSELLFSLNSNCNELLNIKSKFQEKNTFQSKDGNQNYLLLSLYKIIHIDNVIAYFNQALQ